MAAGADDFQGPLRIGRAPPRHVDATLAGEILAGQRRRIGHDVVGAALRQDLSAMDAGGRADSVPEARASVRYSSPTSTRNFNRSRISLSTRTAISFCFGVSWPGRSAIHAPARLIDMSESSPMCRPAILTQSASGLRR